MHPLITSLLKERRDRRLRPPGVGLSMTRLLLGELAWASRQALHPAKMAGAAAAAVAIGVLLGPSTPGPVLGGGWRLAVAVVVGFAALAVAHRLLQRRRDGDRDTLVMALRVSFAGAAVLVVGTFVLSYLLAVVVGAPSRPEPQTLSASLTVDGPLLLGSLLLLGGVLSTALSDRFQVPAALLFLGLGMVVGDDGLALVRFDNPDLAQSLGVAALVVVLFDGGLRTTPSQLRSGLVPGLAMATLGVGITAGVTAVGAMAVLDLESRVAWLLGAVVASTDATAVFAMLRRAPIPDRIASILQVESGANDPVAILLTVGLLAAWDAPPSASAWLGFGAVQLLGGVAVGLTVGGFGAALVRRLRLGSAGLYPVLGLAIAGLGYGVATAFGASGFLAVFVVGVTLAVELPRRRTGLRSFVGTLSGGVEVGLFLLLGLLVFPSDLPGVAGVSIAVAAILVFVARPLAVGLSLSWFGIAWRDQVAIAWLGMRGAVPIVLATLAFSADVAEADLIFDVVFFVVVLSTIVQSMASPRLLGALGLEQPAELASSVTEVIPLDDVSLDVVEVVLADGSPLLGRQLDASTPPQDVLVLAIQRGQQVLVPRGPTELRHGDRLVVATPDQVHGRERIERWVSGAPEVLGSDAPSTP